MGLSVDECKDALAPESLELLRRTTWGRECSKLEKSRPAERQSPVDQLVSFCEALLDGR